MNDKEQQERILWEASVAIKYALSEGLRDDLIDYLDEQTRAQLFNGYVLQEHYDTLKHMLDIARISNKLLKSAQDDHY